MNIIIWNCRGLRNPRAVHILGDLIKSQNPDFLFLSETLVDSSKINFLCSKFSFNNSFCVDRDGRGDGLAIFWKSCFNCAIIDSSLNHNDVYVFKEGIPWWSMTCFYGYPECSRRRESWYLINRLANSFTLP